ncbi:acyl-CoA dehydrogenase [Frankia sp. CcI49]|nr:acyl-CoA dehydrogenase [Frankia sp. CcI49]
MVRDLLDDTSPEAEVRRLMETPQGFDPAVWKQIGDLGLLGLAVPERFGGAGYGFLEVGIVLEEAGRSLLCAPYLSSVVLATSTLLHCGDEAAAERYLPDLVSGAIRGTLALTEESGRWDEGGVATVARPRDGAWSVSGTKTYVLDGHTADLLIVAAVTGAGVGLFAVEADAPGLTRDPLPTMDMTRRQARLRFDETPARLLGEEGRGWPVLSRVLDLAVVGLAAEQVGGAAKTLEMAVEYAKVRQQFGKAIGSFQAVKHRCADMLVEVESARSAAYYGLWAANGLTAELPAVASLAKAYCSTAYFTCAAESIQIHGGIGFTWEHPAHLYFKRARSSRQLFGDPEHHRELVAQRIGL